MSTRFFILLSHPYKSEKMQYLSLSLFLRFCVTFSPSHILCFCVCSLSLSVYCFEYTAIFKNRYLVTTFQNHSLRRNINRIKRKRSYTTFERSARKYKKMKRKIENKQRQGTVGANSFITFPEFNIRDQF